MKYLSSLLIIILAGCSQPKPITPPAKVVIKSSPIERPNLNLPEVDQYRPNDVTWIVLTPDDAEQVFADLDKSGQTPVIFGVSEQGYENIALNAKQALTLIVQQRAVINGYNQYYVTVNNSIAEHNIIEEHNIITYMNITHLQNIT